MNARCTEITKDGHLRGADVPTSLRRAAGDDRSLWIAIEGESTELINWLEAFGLDPDLLAILRDRGHAARFLPLDEAIFFEFPVLAGETAEGPGVAAVICLDHLVIGARSGPTRRVDTPGPPDARLAGLIDPSSSGLVCSLLVAESAAVRRCSLALGTQARTLAARMDDTADSVAIDEIVDLKAGIRNLDELIDEQLAMLTLLKVVQSPFLDFVRVADLFQVAISNTESSDRAVARLSSLASDIQGQYDAHQQHKTNRRLAALTIISAIFLPLTLIAGIYGMNFEVMPELHFRYAYPLALAAMAIIAGALAWYFRSRGWMDEG